MPTKKKSTKKTKSTSAAALEKRVEELEQRLNGSWLHSSNFWYRAFGVVGHYLAAYFAVALGLLVLALLSALFAGAVTAVVSVLS